jgi:ABC-2 type transport system permease protein
MTLLWLAVRSHRTGMIGTAGIAAVGGLLNAFGFVQIAGATHAERLVFAHQMELLGRQFSYILPPPIQLDTMGGYLTWRQFGSIAIVYAIWAVLAATGAARGDEERGLTELWLASGVSRARWLIGRAGGFVVAAAASIAFSMLITALGAAVAGDPLPVGGVVSESIAFLAIAVWAFGMGLLCAQVFLTRRSAALAACGLLILLFLLNSAIRSGVDVGLARWLSPFYYFDRSTPLLAGGALDGPAITVLVAAGALLIALATIAFVRRDVGGTSVGRPRRGTTPTARPSGDRLLRLPVLAAVEQQRGWIAGWAVGLAILAYFLVSITTVLVDVIRATPGLTQYLEATGASSYSQFVGVIWFGTALLIVAIYVVVQANGWAADDAEGRLELTLAQPVSRTRVVLERIASLLVGVAIIAAVSTLVAYVTANANGLDLPAGRTALAGVLMVPVAFALGGVGQALVGWRPRTAVVILGIVTVTSYFTQQFAPIFKWPDWTTRTSVFALYGMPLSHDDWPGIAVLIGLGAAGTVIAVVALRRRDVGS